MNWIKVLLGIAVLVVLLAALGPKNDGNVTTTTTVQIPGNPFCSDKTLVIDSDQLEILAFAGDPDIHKEGNQWVMFFSSIPSGGVGTGLDIYEARLPEGESLTSDNWIINTEQITERVPDQWDSLAMETPNYVNADGVERIYYTGYNDHLLLDGTDVLQVGMAEFRDDKWERHGDPVVTATEDYELYDGNPFVGEPSVVYKDGMYHMIYSGGFPTALIYANSEDGILWKNKKNITESKMSLFTPYFEDGVLSFSTIYPGAPLGGIYSTNYNLGDDLDIGKIKQVVMAKDGTPWHSNRAIAPSIKIENDKLIIFFRADAEENADQKADVGRIICDLSMFED